MNAQSINFPEMSFIKEIKPSEEIITYYSRVISEPTTQTSPNLITVIINVKKDGDGYVATSQKYYKYVGIGDTKQDAIDSFERGFEDDKYGEKLIKSQFCYIIGE